jgi:hypothetical protein
VAGQDVIIPIDRRIILDVSPPPLGSLTVIGTLEFLEADLTLISDWIMVHGTLQVGTEAEPFTHNAIITLTGNDMEEDVMGMGTRGLMVMGGQARTARHPARCGVDEAQRPRSRWQHIATA